MTRAVLKALHYRKRSSGVRQRTSLGPVGPTRRQGRKGVVIADADTAPPTLFYTLRFPAELEARKVTA